MMSNARPPGGGQPSGRPGEEHHHDRRRVGAAPCPGAAADDQDRTWWQRVVRRARRVGHHRADARGRRRGCRRARRGGPFPHQCRRGLHPARRDVLRADERASLPRRGGARRLPAARPGSRPSGWPPRLAPPGDLLHAGSRVGDLRVVVDRGRRDQHHRDRAGRHAATARDGRNARRHCGQCRRARGAAGRCMSVTFDAASAELRLDADAFITLVEYATDPDNACEDGVDRLLRAGAITAGAPHPVLRNGLAAVTGSLGSLQVLVTCPDGVRLHQAWVARVSAVLTDLTDGTYDFAAVNTEFVPTSIAHLTGLQARPSLVETSAVLDELLLDDLASNSARARTDGGEALADLLAPWPAAVDAVRAGGWRLCVVDIAFPARHRTVVRRLAWVDTDAGGLRVEADDHGPGLVPTSSTALWRARGAVPPAG